MITWWKISAYMTAEPFRPFRITTTGGRTFVIRHPEMIQVGRSTMTIFTCLSEEPEEAKERQVEGSLLLTESVEPLDAADRCSREAERINPMITPQTINGYVKAEPFRPFRLYLASGRTFDVRHPEMIKVLRSSVLIFKVTGDALDISDEWETVSLMLLESVSHLEASVH